VSTKRIQTLEAEVRQSRINLSSRWRALELEVGGLANTAKEEVSQSVQHAKDSVSVTHQVEKRPWAMLASSIVVGIALSRLRGFRSLAVLSLATPLVKNALESEPVSQLLRPFTGSAKFSGAPTSGEQIGLLTVVRNKAVNSLAEIAKELVKRNLPSSLVPVLDQAISSSAQSLSTSREKTSQAEERRSTHGVEKDYEIPSIH
jgi:hypothetical protein